LKREDGLIDWSMSAVEIDRRIRGLQPWPNAYTSFNSRRLILKKAAVDKSASNSAQPGEVIKAHGDELLVSCGERTALRVLELQPEDSRSMSARDFLNGAKLKPSHMLGS